MKEKESSSAEPSEGKEELNKEELNIEQLKECQKLKDEYLAGWQRARADLLNYKKEEMERIGELVGYAVEELALRMLPILDNFEIAENKFPEDLKQNENVKGLLLIKNQVLDFLKSQGVEEIKSVGEKFDPNLHEVVEEVEEKDKDSGIILDELQKGYKINKFDSASSDAKLNGRLLRSAKVKITK